VTSTMPVQRQRRAEVAPVVTTPYLELDVTAAVDRFVALASTLPGTAVHYALKANPDPVLLAERAAVGCRFDVASPVEVRAALRAGPLPETLVYSDPVKRRDHVLEAACPGGEDVPRYSQPGP
jgi:ornithine decarboxylase